MRTERLQLLVEGALIVALFFVMAGNAPPAVNEAHYWTKARHYWDPSWCERDPFLASGNAHFVYFTVVGWLTRFVPLPAAAWLGRLLGWSLLAASWQWLSRGIVNRLGYALLTAAVASVLWQWTTMAGEWVIGGLEAKVLSYALVFTALGCMVRAQLTPAIGALAGAVAVHPIVGLWSTLLVVFAWFHRVETADIKRARFSLILATTLAATVILLTWWFDRAAPDDRLVANRVYVYQRLAHHLVLHRMEPGRILRFAALVSAWILLQQALSGAAKPSAAISQQNQCLQRFAMGSLLLVALGAVFDLMSFVVPDLAATALRYYWFRLADVAVPLGVAMLLAELLEQQRTSRPTAFAKLLSICLVLTTAGVASRFFQLRSDRRPGADRQGQVLSAADWRQAQERYRDWRQLCAWAKAQTPTDSLFLTPLHSQTFRWYAHRAELANWKDIPQDAASIVQWATTIHRVRGSGLYKSGAVLDKEILQSLVDEFGINFVVTVKELGNPMPELPVAFQNVTYCVYQCAGAFWSMNIRDYPDLPRQLAERLQCAWPRRVASQRFAPELAYGRHLGPPGVHTRSAAVAVLIYPHAAQWMLPLTLRPDHLTSHGGQVSLPGGACELGETAETAARRELQEELGVPAESTRIVGRMSEVYVFVSDFLVTPVVMAVDARPSWTLDPLEVAEIIEVPLIDLTNPANHGDHILCHPVSGAVGDNNPEIEFRAPHIACGRHLVWGATTVILGELIAVLEELPRTGV